MIYFFLALGLSPLFILFLNFNPTSVLEIVRSIDFQAAAKFTLVQGVLSAGLSVLLGLLVAPGYSKLGRFQKFLRPFLLFPQMVSPLFIILGLFISFHRFPLGLIGVVLGHGFINFGICAMALGDKWEAIHNQWWNVARFLGATPFFYFKKVIRPQVWPTVRTMFAISFSFSVASLAIPLILGGGPKSSTLEVLVLERIKSQGDTSGAVFISLVQFFLQWVIFLIFLKFSRENKIIKKPIFYERTPLHFSSILSTLIIFATCIPFLYIWTSAKYDSEVLSRLIRPLLFSSIIGVTTAVLILIIIIIWQMCGAKQTVLKVPSLSGVIVGLSIVLMFSTSLMDNQSLLFAVLVVSHVCVLTFLVLRYNSEPLKITYEKYFPLFKIWRPSPFFLFKKVFLPLGKKTYFAIFLFSFCWSIGEFSISAMAAPAQSTLPLFIQSLLSQYRLEQAAFCSGAYFIFGAIASIVGGVFVND